MPIPRLLTTITAALALLLLPAAAQARDRDHDGLPDRWEKKHHLSTRANSANADPDRDHVDNRNEFREGTDPRERDSDGDGTPDGREDRDHDKLKNAAEDSTGNDPANPDSDGDGVPDGAEQAGLVSSVAGGQVTIDLANGGSVSGEVDSDTELLCESEAAAEASQKRRGRGHRRAGVRAAHDEQGDQDPGADDEGGGQADDPAGDQADEPADGSAEPDEGDAQDDTDPDADELGDDDGSRCGASAVHVGARVHEAELALGAGGAVWTRIALLRG